MSLADYQKEFDFEEPQFQKPIGPISNATVVIGLLNGMIGGTIPVMPLIGLQTGYLTSLWVCFVTGFISYYTAYLIILHLGEGKNIKDCVMAHFNNDYHYMVGYSFFIWFSFIPIFMIYFRLICLQIEGLMGMHSSFTGLVVAAGLIVVIIIIRICHIGEETLAYGAISIFFYLIFLAWAHITAPAGDRKVVEMNQPYTLASSLMMAYSVHDFLVQNIIKNPNRQDYQKIVTQTFTFGTLSYAFVALGGFAIVNRHRYKSHPETINDFFAPGQWAITAVEGIYMIHLLSSFPNFMLVSKIRFFQMFRIDIERDIHWREVVYIAVMVTMSLGVYLSGVNLQVMIIINGAIVGFTYVIAIPIWVHFKCVFYDRSSGYVQGDDQRNALLKLNACECKNHYRCRWTLYLQTAFLVLVVILGVSLMISTLWSIHKATKLHG